MAGIDSRERAFAGGLRRHVLVSVSGCGESKKLDPSDDIGLDVGGFEKGGEGWMCVVFEKRWRVRQLS